MTFEQLWGYLLIWAMVGAVLLSTAFIATARYKEYGLWFITMRVIRGDKEFRKWAKSNYTYYTRFVVIICLIISIVCLAPVFENNKMYDRPFINLIVAPLLWVGICCDYYFVWKRLKYLLD